MDTPLYAEAAATLRPVFTHDAATDPRLPAVTHRTNTSRRLAFGYLLLAPAALYVALLVIARLSGGPVRRAHASVMV